MQQGTLSPLVPTTNLCDHYCWGRSRATVAFRAARQLIYTVLILGAACIDAGLAQGGFYDTRIN